MIRRVARVELPVTDLVHSVAWYRELLGLSFWIEFDEDGALRGVGVADEDERVCLALRHRSVRADRPDLARVDVVVISPRSAEDLSEIVSRCDRLGTTHGGIVATGSRLTLDVPDPNGTVLRFQHHTEPAEGRVTGVARTFGA